MSSSGYWARSGGDGYPKHGAGVTGYASRAGGVGGRNGGQKKGAGGRKKYPPKEIKKGAVIKKGGEK